MKLGLQVDTTITSVDELEVGQQKTAMKILKSAINRKDYGCNFGGSNGILLNEYLSQGSTITSASYFDILLGSVHSHWNKK